MPGRRVSSSHPAERVWFLPDIYKKLGCIQLEYPLRSSGESLLLLLEEIFQLPVYFASMSMRFKKSPAELMMSPLLVSSGTWRYPVTIKDHTGSWLDS